MRRVGWLFEQEIFNSRGYGGDDYQFNSQDPKWGTIDDIINLK